MQRKRNKGQYVVHNVETAFKILFFLAENPNVSLKQIKQHIKGSPQQIDKILEVLVEKGYIYFNKKQKTYSLGVKNFELGHSYLSHIEIRKISRPYLQKLGDEINENVYLATMSNWEVVYIDAYEIDRPVMVKSRVGKLLPAYASASGKIHLAYLSEDELEEFFKEVEFRKFTPKTITDRDEFLKHLKEVREKGYAIDDEEWEKEVRCLSVPIRNYSGKVIAAITLSAPAYRLPFEKINEIKDKFLQTSAEISEKLGYYQEANAK